MLSCAVFWAPPVHGAGRFTTVTRPDPDGLQTSGLTVNGVGVGDGVGVAAVGVAVGAGAAVGVVVGAGVDAGVGEDVRTEEAAGEADARPAATAAAVPRGPDVTDGRPVARTTPVTRSRQAGTPSPVRMARVSAPRRFGRAIARDSRDSTRIFFTVPVGPDNPAGYGRPPEEALKVV